MTDDEVILDSSRAVLGSPTTQPATVASLRRLRRSPLAHRAGELAAVTGGVALVELPFLSMVNVRVEPGSDVASRVEGALGLALPAAGEVSSVRIG